MYWIIHISENWQTVILLTASALEKSVIEERTGWEGGVGWNDLLIFNWLLKIGNGYVGGGGGGLNYFYIPFSCMNLF